MKNRNVYFNVYLLLILFSISCREKIKSKKIQPNKYCCTTPPPLYPPMNYLIDSNEINCQYENEKTFFNAKLFAYKYLHFTDKKIELFLLIGSNKYKTDSFYFAFPERNYNWNCIQLIPIENEKSYNISYLDRDTLVNLYKLELVGYSKDKGLMIFNSIKK